MARMTRDQLKISFERSVDGAARRYDFSKNKDNNYQNMETMDTWLGYYFCAVDFGIAE